jgi:2-oxo-3-(phosphooxy)propyl 3-oxoalkanoate synthase
MSGVIPGTSALPAPDPHQHCDSWYEPGPETGFVPGRPEETVPRRLVHREADREVLLTGWRREAAESFALRARLPREHRLYADADGGHDPMLLAETVRQAGLLVSHAELDVPFGHQFLMHSLSASWDPDRLRTGPGSEPTDLMLRLTCHDVRRRGTRLAGMSYQVQLYRSGSPIGAGRARFDCLSPAAYGRLRPHPQAGPPAPVPAPGLAPALVGRERPGDVTLTPTADERVWELRVDQTHPVFFDHPVDHVPGMLLVEALRQAAWHSAHPDRLELRSMRMEFHQYTELDRPCLVRATVTSGATAGTETGGGTVAVTFVQGGVVVAHGQVSTRIH